MLLATSIILFKSNILSQNLIQNGSFEYHTSVPAPNNCGNYLTQWSNIASPDYYINLCTNNGVPINSFGFCPALSGNAYMGIGTIGYPYERKECIYQYLQTPLIAGKTYYTSFFLSKSDRTRIATEKIGAYFSVNQPTVAYYTDAFLATPQVENHSGFLTDTVNWVKIDGYFTAQGGEQYITIGNFNSNANTDTLFTGTNNPFYADAGTAYYYIDSVSLYDSLDYALITNIKRIEDETKAKIYPNPNNGNFKLEYHIDKESEFVITDITGRIVNQYTLFPTQNSLLIKEDELNEGVYFYSIKMNNSVLKNDKLIIIK